MRALLLLWLAACGAAPPKPAAPSIDVRSEIEQAEQAEKARRHDLAKIHYEKAIAGAKDPSSIGYAHREYAETLVTWGEFPLAIQHYEIALGVHPKDPRSWHDLGMLKHKQGDNAGAIKALETSRDQAPKDQRPRKTLAVLRWKLGDKAGATAEYRRLLELDLPERLRRQVEWAIKELAKPDGARP
jgi:Flp pilus assembly protein TadD